MKILNIPKPVLLSLLIVSTFSCKPQTSRVEKKVEYVKQIDSMMTKSFESGQFNGNILVAKNDTIVYQKSFGHTDGAQQEYLDSNSIFNIGSISKQFNGVALLILQERGLLKMSDTISKFDLDLPKWSEKVTINHLFNYVSGVPKLDIKEYPRNDKEAWKIMRNTDTLLFEPESKFHYDNGNVFLQRRIIEKVSGQSYTDFVTENIIKTADLTNSVWDPEADYPSRTSCYNAYKAQCPELEFISGWLWQDINDLYKWIQAMNSNVLISENSFNTFIINPYVKSVPSSLGEFFEDERLQRHDGSSINYRSMLLNDLENDVVVILLVNTPMRLKEISYVVRDIVLNRPFKSVYEATKNHFFESVELGIQTYKTLKENHFNTYRFSDPSVLNKLGYELYRDEKEIEEVIKFFKFAVLQFPKDPNIHDSLAEMYFNNKQYDLALINYKKAVELGGTAGNAKEMIKKINIMLEK